ncbi:putative guanidinobutyrase [[Candida] jaroonii]|uniref:Guanidinobutyrase n=1 Tax=[Candida] jaroonii TaxID=467808 RepID=A0ACA9Y608_9ASCO|nr:putative guanidinobutyrase [[Candida] jaroonii]
MKFTSLVLASSVAGIIIDTYGDEPTFMDSIYGQLVDSEESRSFKSQLINSGKPYSQEIEIDYDNFANIQGRLQKMSQTQQMIKSHQGYMKYQTELKLPDDDETSDISHGHNMFGGIVSFGHFDHFNCFDPQLYGKKVDIAIVGAPFDTGVSYRPGARFGPEAIRSGSRRLGGATLVRNNGHSNSNLTHINPYDKSNHNLTIIDCGDVPLTPFDNRIALNQLYRGQRAIHNHTTSSKAHVQSPRIITMGGDHTITLMTLKSAYEQFGPLNVIHFDSHIDTWDPKVLGGGISNYMKLNHGTFLHYAAEQGYLNSTGCYHVGLRAPFIDDEYDEQHDHDCGFKTINARDIDHLTIRGVVDKLLKSLGTESPVYISVDIDVLDPAFAPATGTMEVGGWSTRELLSVLDGLEGINLVGADVVEVSPPFDSNSEITSLAATAVIDSFLGLMIVKEIY